MIHCNFAKISSNKWFLGFRLLFVFHNTVILKKKSAKKQLEKPSSLQPFVTLFKTQKRYEYKRPKKFFKKTFINDNKKIIQKLESVELRLN